MKKRLNTFPPFADFRFDLLLCAACVFCGRPGRWRQKGAWGTIAAFNLPNPVQPRTAPALFRRNRSNVQATPRREGRARARGSEGESAEGVSDDPRVAPSATSHAFPDERRCGVSGRRASPGASA